MRLKAPSTNKWILLTLLVLSLSLVTKSQSASLTRANPEILCVAPAAVGLGNCSNWANACDLQTALNHASDGIEVWVKAGVHVPTTVSRDRNATFRPLTGVELYGGFAGIETIREQRDWKTNITVLSGDIDGNDLVDSHGVVTDTTQIRGSNAYHVVYLDGTTIPITTTTVIDGFVITAGNANGLEDPVGGGIYCRGDYGGECSPVLSNIILSGNAATDYGGGVFNSGFHGVSNPSFTNVLLSGNYAAYGGGMYNLGYAGNSSPTLVQVVFLNNHADEGGGGMVSDGASGISSPTLTQVSFRDNHTFNGGGGMLNLAYSGVSSPRLINVVFSDNSASNYGGGGMFNGSWLDGRNSPILINVVFSDNSAEDGGGMFNLSFEDGLTNPTLINVTFNGNSVANRGGGIYNLGSNDGSNPSLVNCILWGNHAPNGPEIHNEGGIPVVSYSDIQGCGNSGDAWDSACGIDGGGNMDLNPFFVDPDSANLRLSRSSPILDAGNNALLAPDVVFDLDNNSRITDGNGDANAVVDPGAYETQPNRKPGFTSIPITIATENVLYTAIITAEDPDLLYGEALSITAVTLPSWLELSDLEHGTAMLSGIPGSADVGVFAAMLLVTDSGGLIETQSFTLTVNNVNDPPSFTSTPITVAIQDMTYVYDVTVDDLDLLHGDVLTITALTLPSWITLIRHDQQAVILSGVPDNTAVGIHSVILQVIDRNSLTATQAYTITVDNVNDPPYFIGEPTLTITINTHYSYTITAIDPDLPHGDWITITASLRPPWLTLMDFRDGTALLSGTPTDRTHIGRHPIRLHVTDSSGLIDTQAFTLTVWCKTALPLIVKNAP